MAIAGGVSLGSAVRFDKSEYTCNEDAVVTVNEIADPPFDWNPAPSEVGTRVTMQVYSPALGHVVDTEDRPVSNATVRVLEEDGPDLSSMILITAIFEGRGMLTDGGGDLRIPNLSPGRYELEVRWQDAAVREKVRIEAGKDHTINKSCRTMWLIPNPYI